MKAMVEKELASANQTINDKDGEIKMLNEMMKST